jgi:hypothetical protein
LFIVAFLLNTTPTFSAFPLLSMACVPPHNRRLE